jgi:hypothetical protein
VKVTIGKAFYLPEIVGSASDSPKQVRQMKVDLIMRKIAELLPEDYRGVYR